MAADRRPPGEWGGQHRGGGCAGSGRGAALLVPMGNGSRLSFNGIVEFKVPMVGGKIESYLGGQLAEHIPAIQRFTTVWITEHA